jgi:hypothetical protein
MADPVIAGPAAHSAPIALKPVPGGTLVNLVEQVLDHLPERQERASRSRVDPRPQRTTSRRLA